MASHSQVSPWEADFRTKVACRIVKLIKLNRELANLEEMKHGSDSKRKHQELEDVKERLEGMRGEMDALLYDEKLCQFAVYLQVFLAMLAHEEGQQTPGSVIRHCSEVLEVAVMQCQSPRMEFEDNHAAIDLAVPLQYLKGALVNKDTKKIAEAITPADSATTGPGPNPVWDAILERHGILDYALLHSDWDGINVLLQHGVQLQRLSPGAPNRGGLEFEPNVREPCTFEALEFAIRHDAPQDTIAALVRLNLNLIPSNLIVSATCKAWLQENFDCRFYTSADGQEILKSCQIEDVPPLQRDGREWTEQHVPPAPVDSAIQRSRSKIRRGVRPRPGDIFFRPLSSQMTL
jgi:hypothetical protein